MEVIDPELIVIPEDVGSKQTGRDVFRALEEFLKQHGGPGAAGEQRGGAKLVSPDGQTAIEIPAPLYDALLYVVHHMAHGEPVSLVPMHAELTTQQAADMLNVSRPFLIKLLEEGHIPYTKTGTHRRIKMRDLKAYRERRDAEVRRILSEMAQEAQDMGVYF